MTATITVTDVPDLGRMQRNRFARLHKVMGEQGVGALVLLGNSNVSYATGASWPLADPGRADLDRPVAVVTTEDDRPHLFTSAPELARLELGLSADHVHGPVYLEFDEGAEAFGRILCELVPSNGRLAVDDLPGSMRRAYALYFPGVDPVSADDVIGTAKLIKSPDELGLLRKALNITEQAIAPVHSALAPGERQTELTARFLRAAFELGAEANILDPIWQVMPARLADGPWTTHGDIACPLLTTERELHKGDVLWVDTGISYGGFASDFGRTWIVGADPTARQQDQFTRWQEIIEAVLSVTRAGATGAELTRAAMAAWGSGRRPWMEHFYLGHGLGIDSAEAPFIGTDLGDAYDERQVLAAGMVLVLEPLVWDDGASGYHAEEVVAITDDGYISLTDYPYDPPMATEVLADDKALREARRRSVLAAMETHDIDALLLGREANSRYVGGAQRLWTAGSRPYGPGCVVVRKTGAVHLVSTWDEGIPEDIPHEHLFGITWNPGNLFGWLKSIEGLASARRIGTDSLTPRFAQLFPKLFPSAELVDAEPALEQARQVKTPEEVEAIRAAISVAEAALGATVEELAPGVSERHLAAVFMEAMARQGVTTPATQHVARIYRSPATHGRDLVALDAGVVAAGYTGEVGRTWPVDGSAVDGATKDLYQRADDLWHRLLDACRPGTSCHALIDAYTSGGYSLPPFPIASGLGLGFDRPVVTAQLPKTAEHEQLEPGMVLAVTAHVVSDDGQAVFHKEAVLLTADGTEVLTSAPRWPAHS